MNREDQLRARTILDLAEARLRNPQDLTPNTEHDLNEIARIAREMVAGWDTFGHGAANRCPESGT